MSKAAIALVPTPDPDVPVAILELERCLREEIAAIKAAHAHAADCQRRWANTTVCSQIPAPARDAVRKVVEEVMREVLCFADQELSQPGAPLECNADEWIEANFEDRAECIRERRAHRDANWHEKVEAHWETFRPADLWLHLSRTYAPTRVIDEARQRAAAAIIRAFWLSRRSEVKRVGGRVELTIRRYSEKEYTGTRRRYTSQGRELIALPEAFTIFQASAGLPAGVDVIGLARALARTCDYDFRFDSRDRLDFAGGLSVVFFHSEIKVYLPDATGAALNVFVSTYGAELLNDR